ncbi:MAG: type I-U CRISPR-associated RAMP protein Csb1/Cas7u [Leptolyngbya sp. Prado105]|jgi:CRISPR-associated protein Csb1|nr:type I-U CRISPR-associated RAMP protein Csb1/Cas7u [Leptolyngbya sp. Prado105]
MKLNFQANETNIVIQAEFAINGVFNPSTFANVGQLIYSVNGKQCMILDSFASVTNMLESAVQSPGTEAPIFSGLPYIRMVDQDATYQATSITLPHRLASGYLLKNKSAMLGTERFDKKIVAEFKQLGFHATVLKYCPMSLLHGVWFSQLEGGHHKISKSVSGNLVAEGVTVAVAGGVSMDNVRKQSANLDTSYFDRDGNKEAKPSELGIGMIPHSTKRYACDRVIGNFYINFGQIDSYKIPQSGKTLLKALGIYEVYHFLAKVPMHRSDCVMSLKTADANIDIQLNGTVIKDLDQAYAAVETAIEQCKTEKVLGSPIEVTVTLKDTEAKKDSKAKKD